MGFIDRLLGRDDEPDPRQQPGRGRAYNRSSGQLTDEQAIERYRYMVHTAPPEAIEQAHAEAFAKLTPEQRRMVLEEFTRALPPQERADAGRHGDDPRALARMATRAELREPGFMERTFGRMGGGYGMGGGIGMGGLLAGSILGSLAAGFVGSAIANEFFDNDPNFSEGDPGGDYNQAAGMEQAEGYDSGGEMGAYGDQYGSGGDFGGGDLSGGDFGGGEF